MTAEVDETGQNMVREFFQRLDPSHCFYRRIIDSPAELVVHTKQIQVLLLSIEREVRVIVHAQDMSAKAALEGFTRNLIEDLTNISRTLAFPWGVRTSVQLQRGIRTPKDCFARLVINHELRAQGRESGECHTRHKGRYRIGNLPIPKETHHGL